MYKGDINNNYNNIHICLKLVVVSMRIDKLL
jgi:hypothetical protein